MSIILTDRDFGDEDDYNDEDWEGFWDDPEEFVIDDEAWDELARKILEDEEEDD